MTLKSGLEIKVIQTGTIRKLACSFLFAFHSKYGSVLHHFGDKARHWSKFQKSWFFHAHLYSTPPLGEFPSDYCLPIWFEKTIMMGLPEGEKNMRIWILVLTECTNVTDRQTDTLTHTRHRMTAKAALDTSIVRQWMSIMEFANVHYELHKQGLFSLNVNMAALLKAFHLPFTGPRPANTRT